MHADSRMLMNEMLKRCHKQNAAVLDVGSFDVNGNFRDLIENRRWQYVGLDQVPGPNVDVVTEDPFKFPFMVNTFDVVMSGSTMEHVTAFWKWLPELVRVLRPGGFLAIHTHWSFMEHRYPVDCWRFMPDGLKFLFDETGQLERYEIRIANKIDIIGSAFKVAN